VQTTPIDIPLATYRVQLSGHLTFAEVRPLVDYFSRLGIGALYLSPFFRAAAGSTHGYDVVDPTEIDPSLGSEEQFGALAESVRTAGLGLMIDIVPNHMGVSDAHNRWWQDVLANGPGSAFAKFFDIDWNPPKEALRGKVLLPVLGDQFGKVLEEKQIELAYEDERFVLHYFDRAFPTDPSTWLAILRRMVERVSERLEADVPERMELESIVTAIEHLPPRTAQSEEELQPPADGWQPCWKPAATCGTGSPRPLSSSMASPGTRPASICWKSSSPTSRIASVIGGWRPTRSITGGFSTSIRWPPYAWKMPKYFKRSTPPPCAWSSAVGSARCGSITQTDCMIRRNIYRILLMRWRRRKPRGARPRAILPGFTPWWRRFSVATNRCRTIGRCKGRPAMTSSTS